jgi:hypothetical protein
MAIPWLIGGAIALLAGALASSDSDESNDREQEARRRKEAERERAEKERNKKLETARENFAMRGESIGSDIAQSLQGWIEVKFEQSPAFSTKLNSKGYKIEHALSNEQDISALIPSSAPPFEKIRENLKIYSDTYSVKLKQGAKLVEAGEEIEMIESELKQISKLKAKISRLQSHLSAQP